MSELPQIDQALENAVLEGTPHDIMARYAGFSAAAAAADFGEYDTNVVVIDTETTGVSFQKDELTQIAAARLEHGEATEWFVTFVNPGQPIPEEIVHLTHITDDDVADAPAPSEALEKLVEFVGDAKLVAHNAYFDKHFVTNHPAGYPLLENQWIDSLELSRIALPRMKSHRLIDLVKAFGAPLSTHRADDDVLATCSLYRILLAAVEAIPEPLLNEIASFATPSEWPFGAVFQYFAERKQRALEQAELTADELALGRVRLPGRFSLSEVRVNRVSAMESKSKKDAADFLSPALLQRMKQSGSHVVTSGGEEPATLRFPTPEQVEHDFSEDGIMGRIYSDYESRAEQLEMALAVRDAFENSENLMVEAGTGTGKSMAYLVPCAQVATDNDIGIGIATKTNALLDQLVYKELPALSKAMGGTLKFVPLKGFTHYPCLLRVQRILREGPRMVNVQNELRPQAPALAALLSFIEQTGYGDMDALKIDYRTLPRGAVTCSSGDCLRRRCPFYGKECFVHGSRMMAQNADIVVTNHSLLFYDAAADGSLLPPIRYWVVDEAHGAEDEARRALSLSVSVDDLGRLVRRTSSEDPRTNVFLAAARKVQPPEDDSASLAAAGGQASTETPGTLFHMLVKKATGAARGFAEAEERFADQALDLLQYDPQKKSSYELFDLHINDAVRHSEVFGALKTYASDMVDAGEKLIHVAQELVALMDDFKGVGFAQREIASVALELKEMVQAANIIFLKPSDAHVYSVTLNRRQGKGRQQNATRGGSVFHAQLYNVGAALDETLYTNTRSIIYTSATLTVNGSFKPFEESVGLNTGEQSQAAEIKLDPCFDFDSNMKVYVVNDIPEPNSPDYMEALQVFLREAHVAQGGAMLTLFTNKKDMDRCYSAVEPALKESDLRLVCQRWGVSVKGLRDDFVRDEALSLFALKSFWEGFDAPGATLRGVVIPKLPFSKPTDPLSLERKARDDNAWRRFDLPKAVLEVRQAAGRLIRKADDRGALILCDSRLLTKGYGKVFIGSLPSKNVTVASAAEICDLLRR